MLPPAALPALTPVLAPEEDEEESYLIDLGRYCKSNSPRNLIGILHALGAIPNENHRLCVGDGEVEEGSRLEKEERHLYRLMVLKAG